MAIICKFCRHWLASYTPHAYIVLNTALYSVLCAVLYTALYTEHSIAPFHSWHSLFPDVHSPPPPAKRSNFDAWHWVIKNLFFFSFFLFFRFRLFISNYIKKKTVPWKFGIVPPPPLFRGLAKYFMNMTSIFLRINYTTV